MKKLAIALLVLTQVIPAFAGIRAPGKYAGIPVFDRWDGCTLYSGMYVMYLSENAKEALRPHAGKPIVINASNVSQPTNPGDGWIKAFTFVGPAPDEKREWVTLAGVTLKSSAKVDVNGKVIVTISIKNTGKNPVRLFRDELALTLLTKSWQPGFPYQSVDSRSFALITRAGFSQPSGARWQMAGIAFGKSFSWTIGKENALPHDFTLGVNEARDIHISFDLPSGEYDFICGYGGGVHESKGLASNLTAFDIDKNGKGKIVVIKGR